MSCDRHRSAIRAVAFGGSLAADLEEHLVGCPSCRDRVSNEQRLLARIDGEVEELLSVEASPGFVARVRAHLESSGARPDAWAHRWWLPVALSAAALILAVSLVGRAPRVPSRVTPAAPLPVADGAAPAPPAVVSKAPQTMPRVRTPAPQLTAVPAADRVRSATLSPVTPRVVPEVLIPAGDREAVRRFVAGRRHWRVADEPPSSGETETSEAPPVVDWEMEEPEPTVAFNWEINAWPLVPGD